MWYATRAMRLRVLSSAAALVVALGTVVPPAPSRAADATGAFAPYEDLLEVIATLTWHLNDDVYRFPPPRDPTGHDLYRLTLTRLDAWEKRFPGKLRDVTTFTRARVLERMYEFQKATAAYAQVAAMDSPLAQPAKDGAERARAFAAVAAMPEDAPELNAQLATIRAKLDKWNTLVQRYKDTPYATLAEVEEERLERTTVRLVVDHRRVLEGGDATAERAIRFLVEKHADSKNLPEHILRLGDLSADIARQYVDEHERPLSFDEDEFLTRADRALDTYRKVATWDGAREKPEGQARFAAMEAWKAAVLQRYR
jgi:hypothetical protein